MQALRDNLVINAVAFVEKNPFPSPWMVFHFSSTLCVTSWVRFRVGRNPQHRSHSFQNEECVLGFGFTSFATFVLAQNHCNFPEVQCSNFPSKKRKFPDQTSRCLNNTRASCVNNPIKQTALFASRWTPVQIAHAMGSWENGNAAHTNANLNLFKCPETGFPSLCCTQGCYLFLASNFKMSSALHWSTSVNFQ